MLKQRERLSKHDMSTLLKKGRRLHGHYLTLVVYAALQGRCAVVVGKKHSKKATERNRLRRVVYSILRDTRFWEARSLHCAVLLRPVAAHASRDALQKDLCDLVGSMS